MANASPITAEELDKFRAGGGEITRCPAACVSPTQATINPTDRAALAERFEQQKNKPKHTPFVQWIKSPASRERHAEAVRQGKQRQEKKLTLT
jgi:hypothetical protein